MLSGISIVCFAASYAVALGLEVTRLLFRSGIRGVLMIGFAAAGLFAHTVYLAHLAAGASGSPLSSMRDWYLLAAWALAAVYLYLAVYHPKVPFGLFLLPLVLGLVGVARFFADTTPFPREPASQIWGMIHAASILLATVSVLVGFVAGLMYLGQARRLKHKLAPAGALRLPSLEWLQRANSRALVIALAMLGLGILSGAILNLIQDDRRFSQLPWSDPLILSTSGVFIWLVVATGVGLFYRPAREGRRVASLTVVSFVFLVFALFTGLFLNTQHLGAKPGEKPAASADGKSGK
jgi:ABC-type uncharacterized transport system permease subunit